VNVGLGREKYNGTGKYAVIALADNIYLIRTFVKRELAEKFFEETASRLSESLVSKLCADLDYGRVSGTERNETARTLARLLCADDKNPEIIDAAVEEFFRTWCTEEVAEAVQVN
jgi:acetylornithine/succinyldiaminopimelate/putrescine aminotransferase